MAKSKVLTGMVAVAAAGVLSSVAMAAPNPLINGINNRLDYNNWEFGVTDTNGNGALDVGDELTGVLQVQDIGIDAGGPVVTDTLVSPRSILGIFRQEVLAVNVVAPGAISEVIFGPSSGSWATDLGLPAETVIALWNNPLRNPLAPGFPSGVFAADVADASTGDLIGAFGFSDLDGSGDFTGTDGEGFFIATGPDPASIVLPGTANFVYGLHLLQSDDPFFAGQIVAQINPYIPILGSPTTAALQVAGNLYDIVGRGQANAILSGQPLFGSDYTLFSQDPALIDLLGVVPEPITGTMGLMGLGALGMIARRRRIA